MIMASSTEIENFRNLARKRFEIFAWYINRLLTVKGRDVLMAITGPKRMGKSTFALRLALMNDPSYSLDHVVFSVRDYISLIQRIRKEKRNGIYTILDDAGLAISNKKWYEDDKIFFGITQEVVGYLHTCNMITVPDDKQIESTSRGLLDFIIEADPFVRGLFSVRRRVKSKDLTHPKHYWPYLRINLLTNGHAYPIEMRQIYCDRVTGPAFDEYEKKKDQFFASYLTMIDRKLAEAELPTQPRRQMHPNSLANLNLSPLKLKHRLDPDLPVEEALKEYRQRNES